MRRFVIDGRIVVPVKLPTVLRQPGVVAALTAVLLFGMGTPLAKLLLHDLSPWMMAGLLYAGAGIRLWFNRRLTDAPAVRLPRREALWLASAV